LQRYVADLRAALARGGLNAITFLNLLRPGGEQGVEMFSGALPEGDPTAVGFAGEWLIAPILSGATDRFMPVRSPMPVENSLLTPANASSLALLVRLLATQPDFPPFIFGFAATTVAPFGNIRAVQPPVESTRLASRILVGSGARDAQALGDFSSNRAYDAQWVDEKQNAGLRLTYHEQQNSAGVLHVEKALRLPTPETVEAA